MKKLLLIAFLPICIYSFSQTSIDSLDKYSYAIMGFGQSQTILGSGFFIKNKNSLYFITARHCIINCDSFHLTNSKFNLVANKFYPEKSFTINAEIIKLKYPCRATYFDSDYVSISVDTQLSKYFNSVEKFLLPG